MKKLFTLLALLCTAAAGMAQVTFTCTAGKNFGQGEGIDKIFDGDLNTKYCNNTGDDCYALITASEAVYVWGYDMTTANDNVQYGPREVRRWTVSATNDPDVAADPNAAGWVTLSGFGYNNFVQQKDFYKQRFFCDKSTVGNAYKYFKVVLNEGGFIQLSEFSFCYETDMPVSYDWYESNGGDGSKKAVDWLLGQKWEGQTALQGKYLTVKSADGQPHAVKSYSISTHDDGQWSNRAPKEWKVEGSNDNATWTLIDEVTNDPIANNNYETTEFVPQNTTDEFTYVRLTINSCKGTGYQQLGEFHVVSTANVSDYYTNLVNEAKADLAAMESVLGTDDPWCQEMANACSQLDDLLAAALVSKNFDALSEQLNKATQVANFARPFLDGGNYAVLAGTNCWGDGHYSQLLDGKDGREGRESTKWGGDFSGNVGDANHVQYVIFRVKEAFQPYFYRLVTGGDTKAQQGRNWKDWKVYGANFANVADATYANLANWTVLDSRENISTEYLPMENCYPAVFNFTEGVSQPYYYYMVAVTASGSTKQQMNELYLCTQEEFEATRAPLVDYFDDFDISQPVEESMESKKQEFITKFAELQTTDDAVQMTKLYNELVALRTELEASMAIKALESKLVDGVYQLATADDLVTFSKIVNLGGSNQNAVLTADINMEGVAMDAIGSQDHPYTGIFDGQGKTISNYAYNNDSKNDVGLFGYIKGATIKHVLLKDARIVGRANTGGLVGNASNSLIESNAVIGCYVEGFDHVAAIAANATDATVVRNNYSNADVASRQYQAGGLVGTIKDCTIEKNLFRGSVTNIGGTASGLVSMVDAANCTISINNNMVAASSVSGVGQVRTLIYPDKKTATYADNFILDETEYYNDGTQVEQVVTNKDDENGMQVSFEVCTAKSFYVETLGWDMENEWTFIEAGKYPVLKWMNPEMPEPQTITVSAAGYATIVAEAELDFSGTEVEAFTASVSSDSFIHLEPITIVPAGMPVVVKAAEGTYAIPHAVEYGADTTPANELQVSDVNITADGTQYILSQKEGVVGFYKAQASTTIYAGKAYLVITGGEAKDVFYFEGESTGINGVNVDASNNDNVIYNIAGQRLNKMQRGVNIVNGKKVVMK